MTRSLAAIDFEVARANLSQIRDLLDSLNQRRCIYVAGHTHAGPNKFTELSKLRSCKIVVHKKIKVGGISWLPIPKPNYFVLKMLSCEDLLEVFDILCDFLLFQLIVFSPKYEDSFIKEFSATDRLIDWQSLSNDSTYLIYGIDTDDQTSKTGISELFEFGSNISSEFLAVGRR
jgi:hypothetical protein